MKTHAFSDILTFLLLAAHAVALAQTATPTASPTPTCNATYVPGAHFDNEDPDPTYHPGDSITLTILPQEGDDWPTTPSTFAWAFNDGPTIWIQEATRTYLVRDPAPDTIRIYCGAEGPGIRSECMGWFSSGALFTARRFDYNPTPSPTPSPTPTEFVTPTPTACVPEDRIDCAQDPIYPPREARDVPTSFVLELQWGELLWVEELETGVPVPFYQIGEHQWYLEGLAYKTIYSWYSRCTVYPCDPQITLRGFETVASPTPTPSLTPTPPPTPSPTDLPTPTATSPPTAVPSPTPVGGTGWMLTLLSGETERPTP